MTLNPMFSHPFKGGFGVDELLFELRAHDRATFHHCYRVGLLAARFAYRLRLPKPGDYFLAGLLHDIGKKDISLHILNKPHRLSPEEFQLIKLHPGIGERLVTGLNLPDQVRAGIRHHHERWDGTRGYPDGLAGKEIPLIARVLALGDVLDAMVSSRPYRARDGTIRHEDVLGHIESESATHFDPVLSLAFVAMLSTGEGPIKLT